MRRQPWLGLVILFVAAIANGVDAKQREQIGESQGKPVYRDQIDEKEKGRLHSELHRVFAHPAIVKYRKEHAEEIAPTKAEVAATQAYFDRAHEEKMRQKGPPLRAQLEEIDRKLQSSKVSASAKKTLELDRQATEIQLKPPGRSFAVFMLTNWKMQKHLYDKYGGGRILWQQAGLEAYDANRKWLEDLEAKGEFKITDDKLRAAFYEYWTTQNHGSFLVSDPERIRKEFVEPDWMGRP